MPTKLELNRQYAKKLGWKPSDFNAPVNDFTQSLVNAIEYVQHVLRVPIDGVAGPTTYAALLADKQRELLQKYAATPSCSAPARDDAWLAAMGQVAMMELKIWWMRDGGVIDLPARTDKRYAHSQKWIDDAIRTSVGISWTWEDPYEANTKGQGNFEWCGAAAARAWRKAGLKQTVARDYLPSNYRLDRFARYKQINEHTPNPRPAHGPYRQILELDETSTPEDVAQWAPRPGDILLVGPSSSQYGKHITLVESFDPASRFFTTVEGNGSGYGPDGNWRHGIVRAQRPLGAHPGMNASLVYHARRLIRVAPSDLVG